MTGQQFFPFSQIILPESSVFCQLNLFIDFTFNTGFFLLLCGNAAILIRRDKLQKSSEVIGPDGVNYRHLFDRSQEVVNDLGGQMILGADKARVLDKDCLTESDLQ